MGKNNQTEISVKELLARIATVLNSFSNKKYTVNCFVYNNRYEYIGTHHDYPLGVEYKKEKFIAITTIGYDVEDLFCGYLNYPYENEEFYSIGDFILCYSEIDDFNEVLDSTVQIDELEDVLDKYYGLPSEVKSKICHIYKGTKGKQK